MREALKLPRELGHWDLRRQALTPLAESRRKAFRTAQTGARHSEGDGAVFSRELEKPKNVPGGLKHGRPTSFTAQSPLVTLRSMRLEKMWAKMKCPGLPLKQIVVCMVWGWNPHGTAGVTLTDDCHFNR